MYLAFVQTLPMTRDAKLYFLHAEDWQVIKDAIENSRHSHQLEQEITIFLFPTSNSANGYYAILSLSDVVDKIVETAGAVEADEKDYARNALHDYYGEPLYGDKSNVAFLNRFH